MMEKLPSPLVPSDCDLRDVALSQDLFVRMAIDQLGFSEETARTIINEHVGKYEAKRRRIRRRRA